MKGSTFVRGNQPRRRAREDLVRSFLRARRSAGAVRAIARAPKPETAAVQ